MPDGTGVWIPDRFGYIGRWPALATPDGEWTFFALHGRVSRLCGLLRQHHVTPGSTVGLLSFSQTAMAWAVYAALYLGFRLMPLSPRLSEARIADLLWEAQVRDVLVDADLVCRLPQRCRAIPSAVLLRGDGPFCEPSPLAQAEAHVVVPTSGTDGSPKGVMLSGANLAFNAAASLQRTPLVPGDRWLLCLPLTHIGGLSIVYRCLQAGAAVLVHEGFDAEAVCRDLAARRVSHLSLVPVLMARLLDHCPYPPPPSLRAVLIGGGPLSAALARRAVLAGWPIRPTYGMSETASQVATCHPVTPDWAPGDAGPPLPGISVDFVGIEAGAPMGGGIIRVEGPSVMLGYANAAAIPGVGLDRQGFVTGDVGYRDHRGHLRVLGRRDDVLVIGGETVHPEQVEERLGECPGVSEVAVVGRLDSLWGHTVAVLYAGNATADELARWSRRHLPRAWRPRHFERVPGLPRNALGKLDRAALRR